MELDRETGHVTVLGRRDRRGTATCCASTTTPRTASAGSPSSTARQVILQRLREAEDERTFGEFSGREGDVVSGVIQQASNPRDVLVDLGKIEGVLPAAGAGAGRGVRARRLDQVLRRRGTPGDRAARRSRCRRTHPTLVKKLFALEVPEIADGTVEICAIAREAGHRTKIAVRSHRAGVNAKGACIGPDGRPGPPGHDRAARREDRHRRLVRGPGRDRGPRPVARPRVAAVEIVDLAARSARVVVPDYQLSLAIGKEGQNARLAARLTGWRIDIRSDTAPGRRPTASTGDGRRRRVAGLTRSGRRRRAASRADAPTAERGRLAGDWPSGGPMHARSAPAWGAGPGRPRPSCSAWWSSTGP